MFMNVCYFQDKRNIYFIDFLHKITNIHRNPFGNRFKYKTKDVFIFIYLFIFYSDRSYSNLIADKSKRENIEALAASVLSYHYLNSNRNPAVS